MRRMHYGPLALATAGLLIASPVSAAPAEGEASLGASASASTSGDASAEGEVESGRQLSEKGTEQDRDKWIYRHAPTRNMWELGAYGGVWFPNRRIELFEPTAGLPGEGHQAMRIVAPEIGLRAGYYPFRFFGAEVEGGVMPGRTRGTGNPATAWTVRGHLVGQLGLWSITPFLLVGTGILGMSSEAPPASLGSEQDVAIHFGGGAKFFINDRIMLRLDIRDVISNRIGVGEGLVSSPEILLGLSITLGRKKDKKARPGASDRDGDRILDRDDYCPDVYGPPPRGCPQVCIDDNDGDGLENPVDQCPNDPESRNGYEDADGCPDEVPPELTQLAGIMEGITFDTDKDTIKPASKATIDSAVDVMKRYPDIRVLVTGHTDSQGGYRHNVDLSKRRAESVRQYMVDEGIDKDRIETHGAGPDEPISTNDTAEGRALNRRIEFTILGDEGPVETKAKTKPD